MTEITRAHLLGMSLAVHLFREVAKTQPGYSQEREDLFEVLAKALLQAQAAPEAEPEWGDGFRTAQRARNAIEAGLPVPDYWVESCDGEPYVHKKFWDSLPGCGSFHSSRFRPLYGIRRLTAAPHPQQQGAVPKSLIDVFAEANPEEWAAAVSETQEGEIAALEEENKKLVELLVQQPDAGGLVEAIQAAVNGVRAPDDMTKAKAEYFKAGARAAVHAVNNALAAYRAQQGNGEG